MNEILDSMLMPFLVAVGGSVIGLAVAMRFLKVETAPSLTPLVDLDERIEHLIALLKDLEQQKGRLDETFYREEKQRLETEAAATLAQRDEVSARAAQPQKPSPGKRKEEQSETMGFFERRPALRGFLWGALAVGTCGGLYLSVVEESGLRPEGGSMTGNTPVAPPSAAPAQKQSATGNEIERLIGALRDNPNDMTSMVRLSRLLLTRQMFKEADVVIQRALSVDPKHLGALTSQAMIFASRGNVDQAKHSLVSVLKQDRSHADAWFFRGMLAMQAGNNDQMKQFMTEFVRYADPSPRRDRFVSMLGLDLAALPQPIEP